MKLIKDKPIVDINIEENKHVTWMVNNFCPFKIIKYEFLGMNYYKFNKD